jgi:hypothetical protein
MTNGRIMLQGIGYGVMDGEANKVVDGKATEEKTPLKILAIKDQHSGLQLHILFSPEEFDQFVHKMHEHRRIIRASPDALGHFTRNGGIRP